LTKARGEAPEVAWWRLSIPRQPAAYYSSSFNINKLFKKGIYLEINN